MDYIFQKWKDALDKFHDSIEKDLAEVRTQKAAVQQIKTDIINELEKGRYIRDNRRIVLSAPEIVIGNVDKSGQLWDNMPSTIIIRGTKVGIEASGENGSVDTMATTITNLAVDPGTDGRERVVHPTSSIKSKARSISMATEKTGENFVSGFASGAPGISIMSDSGLSLVAAKSNTEAKKRADDTKKQLESLYNALKSKMSESKTKLDKLFEKMDKSLKGLKGLTDDDDTARGKISEIIAMDTELKQTAPSVYVELRDYTNMLSELAELHRRIQALDSYSKATSSLKDSFKDKSTGAHINIVSESITVSSADGDGNIRENPSAGIRINSPRYNVTSNNSQGALIAGSTFNLNSENITLQTSDYNVKDEKNTTVTAKGNFSIISKNIVAASVDMEKSNDKVAEKALSENGVITLRAANLNLLATDTQGKSKGYAQINAKTVSIKSVDVDPKTKEDKQLTQGSTMVLLSEKIYEGAVDADKNKSAQIQIASDKIGLFAKTTAELQQGKAAVQLDGEKLNIGGSQTAIFGDTTLNGKTDIKADLKAPKATIDNLEAKSSFKSTNISDGIAVPASPSSAKLSTKLKEENAPKTGK